MDVGFLFGLLGTWAIILWALVSGGSVGAYYDRAAALLVLGGTFTVLLLCYPLPAVRRYLKVCGRALFGGTRSPQRLIDDLVGYADLARREGILSLELKTPEIDDPFLVRAIQLAVDGTDPEMIEGMLTDEIDSLATRHEEGKGLLETTGKYAPAMGMIGTLVGLVVMLRHVDDPRRIGPGMAVALLTTLYGAVVANAFALPLSDRLARRSSEEVLYKTIIIKGIIAIQSGDNPRIVEQKLRAFLPPSSKRPPVVVADEEAA